MTDVKRLPEEIERYRDRKWRREDALKVDSAQQAEAWVNDIGFCRTLTDARKPLPSVYIAVCGRRDAHLPRNVQKDYEASRAWVLKDEVVNRGKVYYGKVVRGAMFVAPRIVPAFNAIWGIRRADEKTSLSPNAQRVLKVLRREWEMATADLRKAAEIEKTADLSKALDELQKHLKVIPQEVVYIPKFTYIWTTPEARFPKEMAKKMTVDNAMLEIARSFLDMCGMTLLGDLARTFGFIRRDAGHANHRLVDEGFAERLSTGVYRLREIHHRGTEHNEAS